MTPSAPQKDPAPKGERPKLAGARLLLFEQRLRGAADDTLARGIPRRAPDATVPLSPEQRHVWLHAQLQPEVPIYNEPFTVYKFGKFSLSILEASFNEVLRRHEALRTWFTPEGNQQIEADLRIRLSLIDLSSLPPDERAGEATRIAEEDAQAPIALDHAPLFRAKVVCFGPTEHRLYLTFHHLIFDGVSVARIFVPELTTIYAALERGESPLLAEPAIQYGDYALWRRAQLDAPEMREHLAYWSKQLSPLPPVLRLPEDRVRKGNASNRGAVECFRIQADVAQRLRQLGSAHNATLYMALLAAFEVLLFRYSGQQDFAVGSTSGARRHRELESVIGYFLETFALRARPAAGLSFTQFLGETRETVLGALAAADVPFDQVVRELNPPRETGRQPIFQVFFAIRPPISGLNRQWRVEQAETIVSASKFDLHLEVADTEGDLAVRLFFAADIWSREAIQRMRGHFLSLLESIAANPDAPIETLGLLTEAERGELLAPNGPNDTARPFPQIALHQLIEEQAQRTPERTAVVCGDQCWSYRQLNQRADRIASCLADIGVIPGSIVAVALDRSLDMLASLIAVHKSGAAYLPTDIDSPPAARAQVLEDAQPSAIVTRRSLAALTERGAIPQIFVDALPDSTTSASRSPFPASRPEDTAYLMYTSGTTGKPKAVEISHGSLVNLLWSMRASPGFTSEDVLLAVTSITFDIAALELFLPLITGGTVVLASREEALDPYLLAAAIRRSRCTVLQATPARWRILLLSGWTEGGVSSLRSGRPLRALCGGEPLQGDLARDLLATGAELWNLYGPTETTVWSLVHRVTAVAKDGNERVSVGEPIANTTALVLDAHLQVQPVGVPGTLFLGGVGLAKGYRGRPDETARRFVLLRQPFAGRFYNTGDIAVRSADGSIEILGRADNQVKIRGHRVEIEAVEAAILRHPQVTAAAVRAWPDATGSMRLCAYLVPRVSGSAPALGALRTFLAERLPDYMIPSTVVHLASIPLTANGKIERSGLPYPDAAPATGDAMSFASEEEERLAGFWAELLENKDIRSRDNFFDLGGHSVLVAALQQRIRKDLGLFIPLAKLFDAPTICEQAELIRRARSLDRSPAWGSISLAESPRSPQTLLWTSPVGPEFAKVLQNRPFFSVAPTEQEMDFQGGNPVFRNIAERVLGKILTVQPEGPYTLGGLCAGGILAYEVARQLIALGHTVSLIVLIDVPNPSFIPRCSPGATYSVVMYYLNRSRRLGFRQTFAYVWDYARKLFPRVPSDLPQETLERSAFAYRPQRYDGKVLLLLAADHPPRRSYADGWAVVAKNLVVGEIQAHHRDLLESEAVQTVAELIQAQLAEVEVGSAPEQSTLAARAGDREANPAQVHATSKSVARN